jgi:hypothetical protein
MAARCPEQMGVLPLALPRLVADAWKQRFRPGRRMLAGADSIDDMDVRRNGPCVRS